MGSGLSSSSSSSKMKYQKPQEIYSFEPSDVIGQGNNSIVYKAFLTQKTRLASDRETLIPHTVALKIIDKTSLSTDEQARIIDEALFLRKFHHPYSVILYEYFETHSSFWMVMEYLEGGTLYQRVRENGAISEYEAASITQQLASVLIAISKCGFSHNDIRSENIVFVDRTSSSIKLINFGNLSVLKHQRGSKHQTSIGRLSVFASSSDESRTYSGSQNDMWGVGVLIFFALSATLTFYHTNLSFEDRTQLSNIAVGVNFFEKPEWDSVSESAKRLIQKLLEMNPEKRITAEEVLNDPWVKQYVGTYVNVNFSFCYGSAVSEFDSRYVESSYTITTEETPSFYGENI